MDFWKEETLNYLKNSNLKVDCVGNGTERLCIFVQWKVCENSWHAVRFKMILVRHIYSKKTHQGNKSNWTQHKGEFANKIFSKMDVLCKWEQVAILLQTLCNVPDKNSLFFVLFSLKIKKVFFCKLSSFCVFRGPNLSAVNYQNPGKTPEIIKPTLSYRHYITNITLWT